MTTVPTLLNICLEFLSENLFTLIARIYVKNVELSAVRKIEYNDDIFLLHEYVVRNDIFIPENIAEKLLILISKKGKLNDRTIRLFNPEISRLRRIVIPNASSITKQGLSVLTQHKLTEISLYNLKLSVMDVLHCLGSYSKNNLKNFVLSINPPNYDE